MLFLSPPQHVAVLPVLGWDEFPTASGPSQALQTNIITILKAADGGQATTARVETLPDWWLSVRAGGKPDVFACTEQLDEPLAGKGKPPLFSLHLPGKLAAGEQSCPQPLGNLRPPEMCLFQYTQPFCTANLIPLPDVAG